MRLTKQPEGPKGALPGDTLVKVAILTDGLADVLAVNGNKPMIEEIGGLRAAQIFLGSIIFSHDGGLGTLTRGTGTGADFGSFIEEGFEAGEQIRVGGSDLLGVDDDYFIDSVTDQSITLTTAFTGGGNPATPTEVLNTVAIADLTRVGVYAGKIEFEIGNDNHLRVVIGVGVGTAVGLDKTITVAADEGLDVVVDVDRGGGTADTGSRRWHRRWRSPQRSRPIRR